MKGFKRHGILVRNLGSSAGARRSDSAIASYIETITLLIVFIAAALVLADSFVSAKRLSRNAEALTKAVHIAENIAEAASASGSWETFLSLLDENGNAEELGQDGGTGRMACRMRYDAGLFPAAGGAFSADVSWTLNEGGCAGIMIAVYYDADLVYTLSTAVSVNNA